MVKLHLTRDWGNGSSVLGATIRLEAFGDAHNNILAVKDVLLNGPAREAGFIPF